MLAENEENMTTQTVSVPGKTLYSLNVQERVRTINTNILLISAGNEREAWKP